MKSVTSKSLKLYENARQLMDEGNLEDAVILLQQSILDRPHFKTLELLGECFIRLNRLHEAIVPLAAATTLNKGVRAASLLAETFLKLEDYQAAKNIVEIALSRDPNNRKTQKVRTTIAEFLGES